VVEVATRFIGALFDVFALHSCPRRFGSPSRDSEQTPARRAARAEMIRHSSRDVHKLTDQGYERKRA
jgi:hypothetical protein